MEDLTGFGKLAEQIPELTKEARELIVKLLEPSVNEIGLILGQYFQRIRERNLIRGLQKTQKLLEQSNTNPQTIPRTQVFLPILEQMSLVEDDSLQDKWAKLLASELAGDFVHNIYVRTLKDLAPLDAKIIDFIYNDNIHLFIAFKDERNTHIELEREVELYLIQESIQELRNRNNDIHEVYTKHGFFWQGLIHAETKNFEARKINKINDGIEHITLNYSKNEILQSLEILKIINLCQSQNSLLNSYRYSPDCVSIHGTDIKLTDFGKKFMQAVTQ